MAVSREHVKQHLLEVIDSLPEESLNEIEVFLEFQRYKHDHELISQSEKRPLALGGILRGRRLDLEDIAAVRREMWPESLDREL